MRTTERTSTTAETVTGTELRIGGGPSHRSCACSTASTRKSGKRFTVAGGRLTSRSTIGPNCRQGRIQQPARERDDRVTTRRARVTSSRRVMLLLDCDAGSRPFGTQGKQRVERCTNPVDGQQIAFTVSGRGEPVMLLHGLPGSGQEWYDAGYVRALAPHFQLIAVHSRGHGDSAKPTDPSDYAFERIAGDIGAVATACGAERFSLLGYSWGANAAIRFAAVDERVERIIAMGGVFGTVMTVERAGSVKEFWRTAISARASGTVDSLPPHFAEELRHPYDPSTVFAAVDGLMTWPSAEPEQIRCPMRLIVGGDDERVMTALDRYRERIARAKISTVVIPGLDHRGTPQNSEKTLPYITEFLHGRDGI